MLSGTFWLVSDHVMNNHTKQHCKLIKSATLKVVNSDQHFVSGQASALLYYPPPIIEVSSNENQETFRYVSLEMLKVKYLTAY